MPISVIVADDHAIFRQGLVALLQMAEDLELLGQAGNGREAWERIEGLKPDVAILDIAMPAMTGTEVARRAVAAGLPTQTVLLTACNDPRAAMEAQQAGAAGYVIKDDVFEELIMAVQTVVAGGTFMAPALRSKLRELKQQGRSTGSALSAREREVIRLIALGKTGKQIARLMELSPRTVDTYRERLMDKLQAHTVADVVRYAVRAGLVD
jgi:DNA-binding NarL/FixJ family response regulator